MDATVPPPPNSSVSLRHDEVGNKENQTQFRGRGGFARKIGALSDSLYTE